MIALLLAAALAAPTAPPDVPPLRPRATAHTVLAPATVLAKYTDALALHRAPRVMSFEYAVEQTGATPVDQTHRVFRSGDNQRDELLTSEGKRLDPPTVHIFRGRRNRYTVDSLAPRPATYDFRFLGVRRGGGRLDYLFATAPRANTAFAVTQVAIDGARFLPSEIDFVTSAHAGSGRVTFTGIGPYWVPVSAEARATYANLIASERIVFQRYRFPDDLPPSTFDVPRPLPSFKPPVF